MGAGDRLRGLLAVYVSVYNPFYQVFYAAILPGCQLLEFGNRIRGERYEFIYLLHGWLSVIKCRNLNTSYSMATRFVTNRATKPLTFAVEHSANVSEPSFDFAWKEIISALSPGLKVTIL